jgi:MFS family permease
MASIPQAVSAASSSLSQKRILLTWLPLAASWLLMAIEFPYINAALARLSNSQLMIAAFGLAASLSITIESPVISLLSTSTALARSRQNYMMIRRFTIHLMVATTVLQFLLGWTPLFDLVVGKLMGVPESLHAPVQLGLKLMLLWSAAIAWRRFKQGILIRFGLSRYVGQGTVVRLVGSAGTATLLALFTDVPGIAVGALALSAGVIAEAVYAQIAAAPIIQERFGEDVQPGKQADLGYRELVNFHWPLAASNLLYLFTQPLIAAALARSPEPILALAAWPVLNSLLFISRAPEMALPEVVIALNDEKESKAAMRRFSLSVGLACSAFLALVSFTPLSHLFFQTLIGVSPDIAALAESGAGLALLMPLALAFVSVSRGLLTASRNTQPQAIAMLLELFVLCAILVLGVVFGWPGVPTAAVGVTAALVAEAIYLGYVIRKKQSSLLASA